MLEHVIPIPLIILSNIYYELQYTQIYGVCLVK